MFNKLALSVAAVFASCLATSFLFPLASLAQEFNIGDRVEADPTLIGNWKPGVVVKENLKGWSYQVKLDGESDTTPCKADHIRRLSSSTAPSASQAVPDFVRNNPEIFPGGATNVFNVGDRIEADPTLMGNYKPGTVVAIALAGWSYKVLLDGETDPTSCKADHIRHSTAPPFRPAQAGANTTGAAARGAGGARPGSVPAANATRAGAQSTNPQSGGGEGGHVRAATASASRPDAGDQALKPAGKGAPPSGIYNCEKISGSSYSGLGKIEIRGNTYRGIDEEGKGAFHPFSLDGSGGINWSHGLTGLPDGWTIRSSFYAGADYKGRPLIKIYYRSKSGWNDLIDCVREK